MTDSFSPEKLTQGQLSKKILEKHTRMLGDYQREFDVRRKIAVLNEKRDLLEHWIKSAEEDGSNGYERYLKDMDAVNKDMSSMMEELRDMAIQDTGNESKAESKRRYSFLKERIDSHKEALEHWNNRVKELSRKKKKGDGKEKKPKKPDSKKRKARKR